MSEAYEPDSWHVELLQAALDRIDPWCSSMDAAVVLRANGRPLTEGQWVRLRENLDPVCMPCLHASIFGWWGKPLIEGLHATTHCKVCHRSWRSIKEAHCTVCHEQFSSNEAAEQHWLKVGGHAHPSEVKRVGAHAGKPKFCSSPSEFGPVWTLCRFAQ